VVRRRRLRCGIRSRLCCRLHWGQPSRRRLRLFHHRICKDVAVQSGVFTTSRAWAGRDGRDVENRSHGRAGELVCDASARFHCAQDTVPTCADRRHCCLYSPFREMAPREGLGWRGGDTQGHAGDARAVEGPKLSATHVCMSPGSVSPNERCPKSCLSHLSITQT